MIEINRDLKDIKAGFDLSILDEFVRINKNLNIFIWCNKFLIKDILDYFIDVVKCKKYEILVSNDYFFTWKKKALTF